MATTAPYIPDNAPFNPQQRAWLNGFLAGIFSSAPVNAAPTATQSLKVAVLFASQSGTAERLAKKIAKELKGKGHTAEIASLDATTPAALAAHRHAVILASTYGEGDPPEGAKSFAEQIFAEGAPRLEQLRYALFALGDRHYEHFCKFGVDLDDRLSALGASRIADRVESDIEVDEPFEHWKLDLLNRLSAATHTHTSTQTAPANPSIGAASATPKPADPEQLHTRENPFLAPLRERRPLTTDVSSKLTLHLSFGLDGSPVHYQAGDACGVIAANNPDLVAELLAHLPFSPSATIDLPKLGPVPLPEALTHHLQITRLTRKIVAFFAAKGGCKSLSALLAPEQQAHLERYMVDRGLIDLLLEYPGVLTAPQELASILPRLAPRLYYISSSPAAHGRELHTTVAVVRYRSHHRERGGVASTMLADRLDPGVRLPLYIQPNKKFRLPQDPSAPIVMIGPGTGIAPFRAFLHERRALAAPGRNWLFFGERSARTDFLYCHELRGMCDDGHLTRLDTAFSRDQPHKVYVQDRMVEHGAELWRWIDEGAQIFVCGDASRMAKDVDAALHGIVEQHGALDPDAAKDFVQQLHDDRRYHRDVY